MGAQWGATRAGCVPLFDRLVYDEPNSSNEVLPYRTLDREEFFDSIRTEVDRIVSTRCACSVEEVLSCERTILNYGLPDFTRGGTSTLFEQRLQVAHVIESTIEAFEPRLVGVHVELKRMSEGSPNALIMVTGHAVMGEVREPLSFAVALGGRAGGYVG